MARCAIRGIFVAAAALGACSSDEVPGIIDGGGSSGQNGGNVGAASTGSATDTSAGTTGAGETSGMTGTTVTTSGASGGVTATTGTATSGTTQGVMQGDGGEPVCDMRQVMSSRRLPNLLIVLDRSTSMNTMSMTPVDPNADPNAPPPAQALDRWTTSVEAIKTVVTELEQDVAFGLMTFPSGGQGMGRGGCGTGALREPVQQLNAAPISATLDAETPEGYTPTAPTLAEAHRILTANPPTDDEGFPLPQYIMLVTDGDPNCSDPNAFFPVTPDPTAQQNSVAEIQKLTEQQIYTYVIGVDTAASDFAPVLDAMAAAGGTGDTTHRSVSGGAELLDTFRAIAGSKASCEFVLSEDVTPERVTVTIGGEVAVHGEGWMLHDDMRTVELTGASCESLQLGTALVDLQVECVHVPLE